MERKKKGNEKNSKTMTREKGKSIAIIVLSSFCMGLIFLCSAFYGLYESANDDFYRLVEICQESQRTTSDCLDELERDLNPSKRTETPLQSTN